MAERPEESGWFAQQAMKLCVGGPRDIWSAATCGEANVLLGNPVVATRFYQEAGASSVGHYGNISSMRSQLLMLSNRFDVCELLSSILVIPRVAVFTGHMIDHPHRSHPRFPPELQILVKEAIKGRLQKLNVGFGYSSAACGGDILFAEALIEINGETNIYLPFSRSDFIDVSVSFAGQEWVERFDHVLEKSSRSVYATEEGYCGDDFLFRYLGQVMLGGALLRADQLEAEAIAVLWLIRAPKR